MRLIKFRFAINKITFPSENLVEESIYVHDFPPTNFHFKTRYIFSWRENFTIELIEKGDIRITAGVQKPNCFGKTNVLIDIWLSHSI